MGVILIAVIITAWYAAESFGAAGHVQLVVGFLSLVIGVALVSGVVLLLGRLLRVFPCRYGWLAISALLLVFLSFWSSQLVASLLTSVMLVVLSSMLGASIWILRRRSGKDLTRTQRVIT